MSYIKRKYLQKINQLIILCLSIFGITGCSEMEKYGAPYPAYGSPYAVLDISGKVTNANNEAIAGIQISTKGEYYNAYSTTTDSLGNYSMSMDIIPEDNIWIIAKDIDGINNGAYQDDSVKVKLQFTNTNEGNYWFQGYDKVEEDFVLKERKE